MKVTYEIHLYMGFKPGGEPIYQEYNTDFKTKKQALAYAEASKTCQDKGYKIMKRVNKL